MAAPGMMVYSAWKFRPWLEVSGRAASCVSVISWLTSAVSVCSAGATSVTLIV